MDPIIMRKAAGKSLLWDNLEKCMTLNPQNCKGNQNQRKPGNHHRQQEPEKTLWFSRGSSIDEAWFWSTRTQVHSPEPLLKARQEPVRLWCQCRGQRDSRSFSWLARQPSLLWEFQARDRPCLKIQGVSVPKNNIQGYPLAHIQAHMYAHERTYATSVHTNAHICMHTCRNACMHAHIHPSHKGICMWTLTGYFCWKI